MARKCFNCSRVNKFEGISWGALLNQVGSAKEEVSTASHTKGHLDTVKVEVRAVMIKSRLASCL